MVGRQFFKYGQLNIRENKIQLWLENMKNMKILNCIHPPSDKLSKVKAWVWKKEDKIDSLTQTQSSFSSFKVCVCGGGGGG